MIVLKLTTNLFSLVVSVAVKSEANCVRFSGTKQSASRYLPLQTLVAANSKSKSEANASASKKAH